MKIVPAKNGLLWLRDGARIFSTAPVLWMLLVFSYWLGTSLISAIPILGIVVGLAAVPALSVSFYNIARDLRLGRQVTPVMLLSGFRENRPALLNLGGAYLLMMLALFGITSLADGGALAQFFFAGKWPETIAPSGMIVAGTVYALILVIFWFAPALAAWQQMPAMQALFYSAVAALRNWRAMLVYALAILAVAIAVMMTLGILVIMLAPNMLAGGVAPPGRGTGQGAFLMFVMLPAILAGSAIVIASFYASYRDVFSD